MNKKYISVDNMKKSVDKRIWFICIAVVILFIVISFKMFDIMITKSVYYKNKLENLTYDKVDGSSAPRGRIYDRNYNLLVDNKAVRVIYYRKSKKISNADEIALARKLLKHVDLDFSKLSEVNLKEFYIIDQAKKAEAKITNEEWEKLKNRKLTLNDIDSLKKDRISLEDLKIYNDDDKKVAYLFYLMNKGYSYEDKIIKSDASEKEYAYVAEHLNELKGFNVKLDYERVYLYGDTFKTILGNVSFISNDEKSYYLSRGYSLNDLVGTSYLEKQYDSILRGNKDKYHLDNSNNLVLDKSGSRGNDIVLTIDIKLQKEIEKILEKELIATKNEANTNYFNSSFVVIEEPNTGEILAMVGKQIVLKNGK